MLPAGGPTIRPTVLVVYDCSANNLSDLTLPNTFNVPPMFKLPPMPAPPATCNAPVEDEVDTEVFEVMIASGVLPENVPTLPVYPLTGTAGPRSHHVGLNLAHICCVSSVTNKSPSSCPIVGNTADDAVDPTRVRVWP